MVKIGKKYNSLICIGKDDTKDSRYYLFKCDCGNIKSIIFENVRLGKSKTCGCYKKEHPAHTIYGFSHTRIDNIYKSMVARCYKANNNRFINYGGRGIKVCDEWLENKLSFFKWAFENGYSDNLTIDRIDVNGNYCPKNCRWASQEEQVNNKTNSRKIRIGEETHTLSEWANISGIKMPTIWARLKNGWDADKAIWQPCGTKRGSSYEQIKEC